MWRWASSITVSSERCCFLGFSCPRSPLAAAGGQAVVQGVAEGLGGLQDLRAAGGQRLLGTLPEELQPPLPPAHLRDAGRACLPPAAPPRRGRDGQAAGVRRPAGGGPDRLRALRGCRNKQCYFENSLLLPLVAMPAETSILLINTIYYYYYISGE